MSPSSRSCQPTDTPDGFRERSSPGEAPGHLSERTVTCLVRIFLAMGDAARIRLLHALIARGELTVNQLAEVAGLSLSATSHQLRVLRDRYLVHAERRGRIVVYRLADAHVRTLLAIGLEHTREDCSAPR